MPIPEPPTKTRTRDIIGYSLGEGASSLTFNGISAFFMLYYTQALGLPYAEAAMAIAVSSLWDAIVDPLVGHLSDNTQSRWGRRQPYIMVGGLLMAVCFYYLWAVPSFVQRDGLLFFYAVFINFIYRTAYAVFYVPYVALGFEVCPGYHERSKLQATRMVLGMATNLFVALGWSLFFPDRPGGREATSVPANFLHMGTIFSFTAVGLTAVVLLAVRHHITDTRGVITGNGQGHPRLFRRFSGRHHGSLSPADHDFHLHRNDCLGLCRHAADVPVRLFPASDRAPEDDGPRGRHGALRPGRPGGAAAGAQIRQEARRLHRRDDHGGGGPARGVFIPERPAARDDHLGNRRPCRAGLRDRVRRLRYGQLVRLRASSASWASR